MGTQIDPLLVTIQDARDAPMISMKCSLLDGKIFRISLSSLKFHEFNVEPISGHDKLICSEFDNHATAAVRTRIRLKCLVEMHNGRKRITQRDCKGLVPVEIQHDRKKRVVVLLANYDRKQRAQYSIILLK